MKIAIGADHGGFDYKTVIVQLLTELGHEVVDVGCSSPESVDYPNFAVAVTEKIRSGSCESGILICGTGIGMSIAANRYQDIRAAVCHDEYTTRMSREHNNANILCMGARVVDLNRAKEIVHTWLNTDFAGGRHQRRVSLYS